MRGLRAFQNFLKAFRCSTLWPSSNDFASRLEAVVEQQIQSAPDNDLLFELWRSTSRYNDIKSLSRFDARVYSQNGEDGILAEIFRRIGLKEGFFVEIGIENGQENNTRLLLEKGWQGVWMEGSADCVALASRTFGEFIAAGRLRIVHALLTAENINSVFAKEGIPAQVDFLSLDIDQNTSHVWRSLQYKSRVSCIEYNASLPPSMALEVPYNSSLGWDRTNWFGASLKALEIIGRDKKMNLVGCDINGVNAFFVDESDAGDEFLAPYTAEYHFEPPRYKRIPLRRGHPPSPIARKWV